MQIEPHLERIEKLLPEHYKLTLVARTEALEDGDIVITLDDLDKAMGAIDRLRKREPTVKPETK
jgi:hypothetical protein